MKIDPKRLRLYAVTDRAWARDTEGLLRQVAEAIDGGAGIVQLREKHLGQADFLAEAERFVALCREKGAVSIINDDVEIALSVDQANQFDKIQIRLIGGDDKIIHNRSSFLEICCS